jgi:two-component system phosphate regulon sensor histidine kinase PhoR
MVGKNTNDDRYYWELMRNPEFTALVENMMHTQRGGLQELSINQKVFICSSTFIKSHRSMAFVFHDITEFRRIETLKKDFMVNVSHELRTPLTALKGFVDTLADSVDQANRHAVEVIQRHTDRLISIVEDLLRLSELEHKGLALSYEDLDMPALVRTTMQTLEPKLKAKGLAFALKLDDQIPSIRGDAFRLEQLFQNLIDNAIKYTEQGGVTVTLAPWRTGLEVSVADTGIGIPAEHLGRIFERFYVVDKSRSRKTGGTGLGLAIVKHIVLLHQGSIEVKSTLGQGTIFTIRLPNRPV